MSRLLLTSVLAAMVIVMGCQPPERQSPAPRESVLTEPTHSSDPVGSASEPVNDPIPAPFDRTADSAIASQTIPPIEQSGQTQDDPATPGAAITQGPPETSGQESHADLNSDQPSTTESQPPEEVDEPIEPAGSEAQPLAVPSEPPVETQQDTENRETAGVVNAQNPPDTPEGPTSLRPEPDQVTTTPAPIAPTPPTDTDPDKPQPSEDKNGPTPQTDWHKDWKAFYENYGAVLKAYVDDKGDVDYFELRRKRIELIEVQNTIEAVTLAEYEKWNEAEKAAFWINAHNICALRLIIDNYPIKPRWPFNLMYPNGIMQIPGARTKVYYRLVEREYSLDEMERDRLLKQFGDVRYMFTLCHTTRGAGLLRKEPFYPDRISRQVDEQLQRFLSDPRGMKLDTDTGALSLSDMFTWYKEVFVAKYSHVRRFRERPDDVRAYLNFIFDYLPKTHADYLINRGFTVRYISYDWNLNDQNHR